MPHLHIDTDLGVDDALALVVAERMDMPITAVSTVFGNVSVQRATTNALIIRRLLNAADRFPIFTGASGSARDCGVDTSHIYGNDGLGGATATLSPALLEDLPLISDLPRIGQAAPHPGSVTILGLGPATNIPALVQWYGRARVARIVLMSGVFCDIGNITKAAEFNAYADPEALGEALALRIPTTLVPLDICRKNSAYS